jgi:PAS domain S-box-containing protein
MSSALSVLLLEDDPSSIRLFSRKMQTAPVEITMKDVRNKESFVRELETPHFDCIVIDFTLPDINGIEALQLVKEMSPGTPTIIYTGSVGEEKAAECMKEGASEFLLKTNSIRLVPAILSVVNQKRDHDARLRAEEVQKQTEILFRTLAEMSDAALFIYQGERFIFANSVTEKMTGYAQDELLQMNFWSFVHPEYQEIIRQRGLARQRGEEITTHDETKILTKDGKEIWLDFSANVIQYYGIPAVLVIAFDVTSRKKREERLKESEQRYRTLCEANPFSMFAYALETQQILMVNTAAIRQFGYSHDEFLLLTLTDLCPQEISKQKSKKKSLADTGKRKFRKSNGEVLEAGVLTESLEFNGHKAEMILVSDIKEEKRTRKKKSH